MARLPFAVDRPERDNFLDLKRDRLPKMPRHPINEIDKILDDIVYNAIDYIQEEADRSDLRTFYFNLMSDRDWENRDFEELIEGLGSFVDFCLESGKARDEREALGPKLEQFIQLSMAYIGEQYPDVTRDLGNREFNDLQRNADAYHDIKRSLQRYASEGGNSRRREGRYRDDDRGRYRRDTYNRDAIRGGRGGSPNSAQSDRFDTDRPTSRDRDDRRDSRDSHRDDNRDDSRDDRYADNGRRETTERQRLPHNEPAPARTTEDVALDVAFDQKEAIVTQGKELIKPAAGHLTMWVPSLDNPHPPAFNYAQELMLSVHTETAATKLFTQDTGKPVNYEEHKTLAFGSRPRDFGRFNDIVDIPSRVNDLCEAVRGEDVPVTIKVGDEPKLVNLKKRLDIPAEVAFIGTNLSDIFIQLEAARSVQEADNFTNGNVIQNVEIATAHGLWVRPIVTMGDEHLIIEDLLNVRAYAKIGDKLRASHRSLSLPTFSVVDQMLAKEVNRVLAQRLSIPKVSISSITGDWMELYQYLTETFGEGYRDMLQDNASAELAAIFNQDERGNAHIERLLGKKTTTLSLPIKVILVREVAQNLNIDLVPGVASELLQENVPFFYDLAQDVLKEPGAAKRFFVQTQDRHVFELSGSYVNQDALLIRKIA